MHSLHYCLGGLGRSGALWRGKELEGTGLGPYDHSYLFYICRHPGISQESLGRALFVHKSHVTRHLSRLEEGGYISRVASPSDRRVMLVSPTEKALAILPRLSGMTSAWEKILTEGFTEEETALYRSLSERALANARAAVEGVREEGDA